MELICPVCQKEFIFKGGPAHYKRTKQHFCSRSCQGIGNNITQGNRLHGLAGTKKYKIWCDVKKRAKDKGTEFTIEPKDIPEIPDICPVLGIKIIASKVNGPLDSSPSIDRINPKHGYIKGNIRIISNRANRIKSDATIEEIELILKDAKTLYHNN